MPAGSIQQQSYFLVAIAFPDQPKDGLEIGSTCAVTGDEKADPNVGHGGMLKREERRIRFVLLPPTPHLGRAEGARRLRCVMCDVASPFPTKRAASPLLCLSPSLVYHILTSRTGKLNFGKRSAKLSRISSISVIDKARIGGQIPQLPSIEYHQNHCPHSN